LQPIQFCQLGGTTVSFLAGKTAGAWNCLSFSAEIYFHLSWCASMTWGLIAGTAVVVCAFCEQCSWKMLTGMVMFVCILEYARICTHMCMLHALN
jgi:hypothetical protein